MIEVKCKKCGSFNIKMEGNTGGLLQKAWLYLYCDDCGASRKVK